MTKEEWVSFISNKYPDVPIKMIKQFAKRIEEANYEEQEKYPDLEPVKWEIHKDFEIAELKREEKKQMDDTALATQKIEEMRPLGIEKFREDMKEQGRVVLPFLKLIQPPSSDVSRDKVPPGVYRNSLSGEVYGDKIEFIPVGVLHWRRRFVEREVWCSSQDGVIGIGDPGGECRKCPLSFWTIKTETGDMLTLSGNDIRQRRLKKGEELYPPPCTEQYVFPSIVLNSQLKIPGALVFSKTNFQQGINLAFLMDHAPITTVYKAETSMVESPKGVYYFPKVSTYRQCSPEEALLLLHLRESIERSAVEVAGIEHEEVAQE